VVSQIVKIQGMMDPHVHLRGMDWAHKGTFASETAAALAGGYTAVLDMPNTPPPTVNRLALNRKLDEIGRQAYCDWGVFFGASQEDNVAEFDRAFVHVCGMKVYADATTGTLLVNDPALLEKLYSTWPDGKPVAFHAEGETIETILKLVRRYRKPVHFCHISTAEEINLLMTAKEARLPVTVGVTPHHLFLTEDDARTLGPKGLMKPGLKSKGDQRALWLAIDWGIVDVIESDHAPHTLQEKASANPPYGVPGLETTLPLLGLAVQQERLSLDKLVALVATNPRRIFGVPSQADTYTVVDLASQYVIDARNLHTACGWSPFEGMGVAGRVLEVWIRGQKVFDGENILVAEGFGRNLYG